MGSDWDHCINAVICMIWQIFTVPAPPGWAWETQNFSPEGHQSVGWDFDILAFVPTVDSDLRPYVKESQTAGLHSVNCLCMKVKCIRPLTGHGKCFVHVLWEEKKRKDIYLCFCFLYWPEAFILIWNSSLGKEGKQMVYLYIHNARFLHIIFGEHKVWLRKWTHAVKNRRCSWGAWDGFHMHQGDGFSWSLLPSSCLQDL